MLKMLTGAKNLLSFLSLSRNKQNQHIAKNSLKTAGFFKLLFGKHSQTSLPGTPGFEQLNPLLELMVFSWEGKMGVGHIMGCSMFDPISQTRDFHVRKRAEIPGEQAPR